MKPKTLSSKFKWLYKHWRLSKEVQELCAKKEWLTCVSLANQLIAKSRNDFFGHYYKGICYTELKLFDEALESFEIALENVYKNLFPKIMVEYEQETILRIAHIHRLQRNYDIAIEQMDRLIAKHPKYVFVYKSKAGIYIDMGDDRKALETVNIGLKHSPKDEDLLNIQRRLIYSLTSENP